MDGRYPVAASSHDGERSQFRVETEPGSSEELIKDVVLLSIPVRKTRTEDVHSQTPV